MDLDPRVDENGIEHDVLGRARTRQAHGLAAQLGRRVDGVLVFRRDEDGYGRRRGQAEEERRGHARDVTLTIGGVQRSGSQIGLPSREGLSGITLGAASLVLATIQGNVAGIYVQGVTVVSGPSGSFTVHLNKATTKALKVGWFVVN